MRIVAISRGCVASRRRSGTRSPRRRPARDRSAFHARAFFPSVDKRQVTFKRAREYECCKNTRRGRCRAGRTNAADSAPPIIPRFPASCVLFSHAANVCARAKSSFRCCVRRLSLEAPSLIAARPISRIRRLKLGRFKGGGFLLAFATG